MCFLAFIQELKHNGTSLVCSASASCVYILWSHGKKDSKGSKMIQQVLLCTVASYTSFSFHTIGGPKSGSKDHPCWVLEGLNLLSHCDLELWLPTLPVKCQNFCADDVFVFLEHTLHLTSERPKSNASATHFDLNQALRFVFHTDISDFTMSLTQTKMLDKFPMIWNQSLWNW